jgi:hypothetical protein
LQKITNGSGEPPVTIRASLNKIASDLGEDSELVIFLARKKRRRMLDVGQETLERNRR